MSFSQPVDIANRALQYCGASRIVTMADDDKGAAEISQCYDGLRRAELRRNVWKFAIKRTTLYPIQLGTGPTMQLVPNQWVATKTYAFGAIVSAPNSLDPEAPNQLWVSTIDANTNNIPGAAGVTAWDTYFGSLCVNPFVSSTANSTGAYFAGDLVYESPAPGKVNIYANLVDGNTADPMTPLVFDPTHTYNLGEVVQDAAGFFWRSMISVNLNFVPGVYGFWSATPTYVTGAYVIGSDNQLYQAVVGSNNVNPANNAHPASWLLIGYPGSWPQWNVNTTYANNEIVAGSDGHIYQSLQANNLGHQPIGSTIDPNHPLSNWWSDLNLVTPWTAYFATSTASDTWVKLDATMTPFEFNFPVGDNPGAGIQSSSNSVFRVPNGYLRKAPQEPKAGSVSFLGAPSGRMYKDWVFDGDYIITRDPSPIVLRFVADITQVSKMDDMFCEGLAARIASAVCETITQSSTKLRDIASAYRTFMTEARIVNGIEEDPVQPAEDDYITCRI